MAQDSWSKSWSESWGFSWKINVDAETQSDPLATLLLSKFAITERIKVEKIAQTDHVNVDADNTPWIGIYRLEYDESPIRLGEVRDYDREELINIFIQAASYKSGADCEQRLDNLVARVIASIWTDTTINNSVECVNEVNVEYKYDLINRKKIYFQTAIATVKTLKAVKHS